MYAKTQQQIKALVTNKIVPGVSYGFIDHQQTLTNYVGASQLIPTCQPLYAGQLYDLASLTKVIATTTLILKLITQHQLALDDPIQKFLPTFKDQRVQIRHLLTHTVNLVGYIPHRNQLTAPELKQALLNLSVGPNFGKQVHYSDTEFLYLGWIIERLLQRPAQQALFNEVIRPLHLTTMTFHPDAKRCVPASYQPHGRGLIKGVVHDPKAYVLGEHAASAGLFANLTDVLSFCRFMLGDWQLTEPLLDRTTIQQLYHDYTGCNGQRSLGWDLKIGSNGQYWLYHTGYVGHLILINQQAHQAFVLLSNRIHPTEPNTIFLGLRDQIAATYLKEAAVL
ncbi:serine hydrolase domain-containing protein [Loigolactobacillus rennini]|nr:serine hydrolase [Loigolactobacillus rennini]SFZ87797.1 Beta-lactamase class C and other penicillin binding proteins [Loigolactobacillus rennini]